MRRSTVPSRYILSRLNYDKTLIGIIGLLLLFGLVILYDATAVLSQNIYGYSYRFVLLQLAWILGGSICFHFFSSISLDALKKLSFYLFVISLFFLTVLAVFGLPSSCTDSFIFAPCINGANRWFYFNPPPLPSLPVVGVLGFQPSELTKFATILFLAWKLEEAVRLNRNAFKSYLKICLTVSVLIALQPNMSTATLIFILGTLMYIISGADLKPILLFGPLAGLAGSAALLIYPHTRLRILTFLGLSAPAAEESSKYHITQVLIALGSGGLFGLGFGQSRQKFQYLPEVFADSIFAIIGEELGFVGTFFLLCLFALLIYKGLSIAKASTDLFAKTCALGITCWVAMQVFINIGAMTRIIPLTGIPLPLISYGGSSMIFIMSGLGVLANISRKTV